MILVRIDFFLVCMYVCIYIPKLKTQTHTCYIHVYIGTILLNPNLFSGTVPTEICGLPRIVAPHREDFGIEINGGVACDCCRAG